MQYDVCSVYKYSRSGPVPHTQTQIKQLSSLENKMPFTTRRTRRAPLTTTGRTSTRRGGFFSRGRNTRAPVLAREPVVEEPVIGRHHRKQGFFAGLLGPRRSPRTRAVAPLEPVHHQNRRVSIGDKIHGFGRRLVGSLTGRPGKKAAGTRMMRGTDGRGTRRRRYF